MNDSLWNIYESFEENNELLDKAIVVNENNKLQQDQIP